MSAMVGPALKLARSILRLTLKFPLTLVNVALTAEALIEAVPAVRLIVAERTAVVPEPNPNEKLPMLMPGLSKVIGPRVCDVSSAAGVKLPLVLGLLLPDTSPGEAPKD